MFIFKGETGKADKFLGWNIRYTKDSFPFHGYGERYDRKQIEAAATIGRLNETAEPWIEDKAHSSPLSGRHTMQNSMEARRKKLLQEIERVDREITLTQKSMARIESQIAAIQQPRVKAA